LAHVELLSLVSCLKFHTVSTLIISQGFTQLFKAGETNLRYKFIGLFQKSWFWCYCNVLM